ncbi:hypothetical protein BI312_01460 [Xanthomonas citri pv. citri]|nr:hypothetical protein AB890_10845 [Xanthomonas citri pv. citri]APR11017.1 hypothetical protein BI314_13380 [Xanthomonas citri pv. citri]APR13736.1 hypothetical protein BI315_01535 [Xanthomonas citri pv. citri]APR20290.1 hypothetical protein BI316_12910 [Xanthomonas citri pv. citri]APR23693.1 hypothetical protein BJD09_05060 [Xanthomonas citri pv. citri]
MALAVMGWERIACRCAAASGVAVRRTLAAECCLAPSRFYITQGRSPQRYLCRRQVATLAAARVAIV